MIIGMLIQVAMAFVATLSFSVIFNVPKKELGFCGLTGAFGWLIYQMIFLMTSNDSAVFASFVATLFIAGLSRFLSYKRKMPITIYLISGIIPLVPGAGIYYTMYDTINNEGVSALSQGVEALKIAGVICIGMIMIFSLPKKFFDIAK